MLAWINKSKPSCLISGVVIWLAVETGIVHAATYGQQVVAAVLLAEARSEGPRGMWGVAEVIRTRADGYGLSPLAVVKMKRQFSCLNDTTPPRLIRRHWNDPDWPTALQIARTTYNAPQQLPGFTHGATHFHSDQAFWSRGHRPIAIIGKLKFYRLRLPSP